MRTFVSIALCGLALAGCKKKGAGGGDGDPGLPDGVAPFMQKGVKELWQGAWSSRLSLPKELTGKGSTTMAGDPVAIGIKGDAGTIYGGTTDVNVNFLVNAPCSVELQYGKPSHGGTETYFFHKQFLLEGGKLVVGDGPVGVRKGKAAVVCASELTTLDESGKCQTWHYFMNKWDAKPETCAWSQKDGKDVLTVGSGEHFTTELIADGDNLASDQFRRYVKEGYETKVADFAAAKAMVDAKRKEHDPAEQAKALGGKVGDLTTVRGLVATYGSDKTLKGKPIELTVQYENSNSWTQNSDPTKSYNVVLVDDKDTTKISITCDLGKTAPPDGLTQWDKVTAKGTIGESMDQPSIEGCSVVKAP